MPCPAGEPARPDAAGHPALPVEVLLRLIDEGEPAAAGNPALPLAVMERLVERGR
jgi:hypothetical protein